MDTNTWNCPECGTGVAEPKRRGPHLSACRRSKNAQYEYPKGPDHPHEWITCRVCLTRALVKAHGKGFCSKQCSQLGENNSAKWLGSAASYGAVHQRVYRTRGRAEACAWGCASQRRYEWANLTGELHDVFDYTEMCKRCHQRFDFARSTMEED